MSRAADVARRDAEILAIVEQLGPGATRREQAQASGYSPARVQAAINRRRAAEAEAAGEPPPEKAATKPNPKPILVVVEHLAKEAWRVQQAGRSALPSAIRRALAPLRSRDGWLLELRQAVERALAPPPVLAAPLSDGEQRPPIDPADEALDILNRLRAQSAVATGAEARQLTDARLRTLLAYARLQPPEQREGMVPASKITEASLTGWEKLRQLTARLERQQAERVQATVEGAAEQAKERGPEFYAGAVWALRQMGHLPKEGDGGDDVTGSDPKAD